MFVENLHLFWRFNQVGSDNFCLFLDVSVESQELGAAYTTFFLEKVFKVRNLHILQLQFAPTVLNCSQIPSFPPPSFVPGMDVK